MVRATGQDGYQVYPEAENRFFDVYPEAENQFFYRVVDAQITFELGPGGAATALVLHQNGRNRRGKRLP